MLHQDYEVLFVAHAHELALRLQCKVLELHEKFGGDSYRQVYGRVERVDVRPGFVPFGGEDTIFLIIAKYFYLLWHGPQGIWFKASSRTTLLLSLSVTLYSARAMGHWPYRMFFNMSSPGFMYSNFASYLYHLSS